MGFGVGIPLAMATVQAWKQGLGRLGRLGTLGILGIGIWDRNSQLTLASLQAWNEDLGWIWDGFRLDLGQEFGAHPGPTPGLE